MLFDLLDIRKYADKFKSFSIIKTYQDGKRIDLDKYTVWECKYIEQLSMFTPDLNEVYHIRKLRAHHANIIRQLAILIDQIALLKTDK